MHEFESKFLRTAEIHHRELIGEAERWRLLRQARQRGGVRRAVAGWLLALAGRIEPGHREAALG